MNPTIPIPLQDAKAGDLLFLVSESRATLGIFEHLIDTESNNPRAVLGYQKSFEPAQRYYESAGLLIPRIENQYEPLMQLERYQIYRGEKEIRRAFQEISWLSPYEAFMARCEEQTK